MFSLSSSSLKSILSHCPEGVLTKDWPSIWPTPAKFRKMYSSVTLMTYIGESSVPLPDFEIWKRMVCILKVMFLNSSLSLVRSAIIKRSYKSSSETGLFICASRASALAFSRSSF